MQDLLTLRGFVASDPAVRQTASGARVTSFRLASTERRFDRSANEWVDAHTNWFTVSAFGQLGENTAQSVKKGNPVIVTGRLRVRDWSTAERSGTTVDVAADAVGLDLGYGSVAFQRSHRSSPSRTEGPEPARTAAGPGVHQGDGSPVRPGEGEGAGAGQGDWDALAAPSFGEEAPQDADVDASEAA